MDMATSRRRGPRQWLLPVVLALGAIAGVLLAIVLLTRPSPPLGQASSSVSSAPSSAPTSEASASAIPSSAPTTSTPMPTASPIPEGHAQLAWTDGPPQQDAEVHVVIRFGDQYLAGGSTLIGDKQWAAVWTSDDGLTWSDATLVGPEPETDGDGHSRLRHVIRAFATWDEGLVAFGIRAYSGSDTLYPMLWRSTDGVDWELVDTARTPYGESWHVPLRALTAPDGGLVLHALTDLGQSATAYVTHDLVTWESSVIADGSEELTSVSTASAGSPDLLMIVGWTSEPRAVDEPPRTTAHVWTSTDGLTWTEKAAPDGTAWLHDVAWDAVRERFVVVGTDAAGLPKAWLSPDGSSWTSIALGAEPMQQMRVSAADALIVATGVGGPLDDAPTGPTIAWSSHDGISWWYGTVLNRPSELVTRVFPGAALLIDNRSEFSGGRWLPLVGTLAETD